MTETYPVRLRGDEREALSNAVAAGRLAGRELTRARILLAADVSLDGPRHTNAEIAEATGASLRTVKRVRKRYVVDGLTVALTHRDPNRFDDEQADRLFELASSPPPPGHRVWTQKAIVEQFVHLDGARRALAVGTLRSVLARRRQRGLTPVQALERNRIWLGADEREALSNAVAAGRLAGRELTRARILLAADVSGGGPGRSDVAVADAVGMSVSTVKRIRRAFLKERRASDASRTHEEASASDAARARRSE